MDLAFTGEIVNLNPLELKTITLDKNNKVIGVE